MTSRKSKMSDGRASRAGDDQPDLKWVVEWLVEREGQRRTAALLGVNRKTVALALQRERLTGRMTLAVQRLMANLDDPGWERTTPLDRLEARIRLATRSSGRDGDAGRESDAAAWRRWRRRRRPRTPPEARRRMRPTPRAGACVCSTGGGGVRRLAREEGDD